MRRWFLVSLGLHVVVLAVGTWLSYLTVTSPPTMDSITVGLAVAPAQAREPESTPPPAVEPEPDPPAPLPEPEPEPVVETPEPDPTPPPVPREIERPEREPEPDPAPAEEPERPVDLAPPDADLPPPPPVTADELLEPEPVQPRRTETAQAAPDTAQRRPEAAPTRQELGEGAAVGATALSDVDDGYLVRVQQKIGRRWAPTPASALGQKYVTTVVSFRIRPDGHVEAPAVSESSGLSVFDRQALRAVIDASPLPPLPPRYPDGVHINFRFEYER